MIESKFHRQQKAKIRRRIERSFSEQMKMAALTAGPVSSPLISIAALSTSGRIISKNIFVQVLIAQLALWIVMLAQFNKVGHLFINSLKF